VLLATGVELSVADADVRADGAPYPSGSIVIRRDQPYGAHVKDLFEVQRYPPGDPPYDVAGGRCRLVAACGASKVNELASVAHAVATRTAVKR
jgi:hypothetical protein